MTDVPTRAMPLGTMRGGGAFAATANAAAAAVASAQQAQAIGQQATGYLTRAMQAIQAMQQAQAAARAVAQQQQSLVPNGLGPGGLVVDPRVAAGTDANLWQNISQPSQVTSNGRTTVTLTQSAQRAVATWEEFNVGKNTIVDFNQSGGNSANGNNWVVLNRIDATGVPSQIEGQIRADGTVLIINPNGIVFSGTSQVNVHSLIAAAMDLNGYSGTNFGVFNSAGTYNEVAQTLAGQIAWAPANEDSANQTFLASGLFINNAVNGSPGQVFFAAPSTAVAGTNYGVRVEAGAEIVSAISGTDNGGTVALLGPTVTNAGSIMVPSGQVILAAGTNLGLSQPAGAVNLSVVPGIELPTLNSGQQLMWTPASDPGALGALAVNDTNGLLSSDRGNVTLFGDTVQQLGGIDVTTSITRAGSIDLRAIGTPADNTSPGSPLGGVVFGPGSLTAIRPDENGETIPESSVANSSSAFVPPSISILNAANVDFQSGSFIEAPGASFSISGVYAPPFNSAIPPVGRVLLESGSIINLAGTNAAESLASYLYTFKVTANDVADSPLARGLIGQTVTIDLLLSGTRADGETWVGSPLFASSGKGYLEEIPESINELLSRGGSFTVAKGNGIANFSDFIQEPGSLIDVSGGFIQFAGTTVDTTRLLGADGQVYDIGSADPTISYSSIAGQFVVDHAHWGITEYYSTPLSRRSYYQPGYIDGVSAGSVSVSAVNPILEGDIVGSIVTGLKQAMLAQAPTGSGGAQTTFDQLPSGAALAINLTPQNAYSDEVVLADTAPEALPTDFNFLTTPYLNVAGLPTDSYGVPVITYSTSALSAEGLGSITIKGAAFLSMAPGAGLSVLPGGSVTLNDATTIDGTIIARGGTIALAGFTPTATLGNGAAPVAYENLVLGPDAVLNVSGLWVNDALASTSPFQGKAYTNGGSVSLTTYALSQVNGTTELYKNGTDTGYFEVNATDETESVILDPGSLIDVSSGGYVGVTGPASAANGLLAGTGGNLSLSTYVYGANAGWTAPVIATNASEGYDASNNSYAPLVPNAATVVMDGTIDAGGLSQGGSFSLRAPAITVDGAATSISSSTSGSAAGTITLPAAFFQGGFANYNLTSTYGSVAVTPGTTLVLKQQNYQLAPGAFPSTGAELRDFASLGFAPDGLRQAASLSMTEIAFTDGTAYIAGFTGASVDDPSLSAGVVVGAGASIVADPQASISLVSGRSLDVLGDLTAHAGTITLAGGQDTWIGSDSTIDVSGTFVPNPLITAYQTGTELAGGSITFGFSPFQLEALPGFSGGNGAVIVQSGALLNLAGGEATVQLLAGFPKVLDTRPLWSDGGTLVFNGSSDVANGNSILYLGGTIDAAGGAPAAAGGAVDVGNVVVSAQATNGYADNAYTSIVVTQGGDPTAPFGGAAPPATASQLSTLLSQANAANGTAYVTADTLAHSGFSTIVLNAGQIRFPGSVSMSGIGELDLAGSLALPAAGGAIVNLAANDIRLFGYKQSAPTLGDGTLNLNAADQIDIEGAVSASGASNVNLASGGDIQLIWADGSALSSPLVSFPTEASGIVIAAPALSATSFNVPASLTLTAREVYAATATNGVLLSLGLASNSTITIASNGATPVAPLSAGGSLLIDAPAIVQDGALYAPLGTIQLGVSTSEPVPSSLSLVGTAPITNSVTLGAGSLTSVSIAGLDVPYGYTINGDWQISMLPQKQVILAGANVTTQAGAALDLAGGGDVYATEFVAGTGGSRNVLTTTTQTVYALVPSYESDIAAAYPTNGYNLTSWNRGGTDAATAFSLQPGMSVTLPGGNGIPAGTYVLMPAMYATLPGAYRVAVASANFNPDQHVSFVADDGTVYMTGTFGNAVIGETSSQMALLEIQSKAVWSNYSEIDISSANSAFTQTAAQNGTVTPRLPIDAGQLILAATSTLNVNATDNFAIGSAIDSSGAILTGRGGLADITGTDLLVVAADLASTYAANSAYDGAIFLDPDQLSHLGVASLLVGGVRTPTSLGISITPTATSLTVATDAAHPLTAPDLMLATQGSITDTAATTQVNAATGTQTVTVGAGLSGIMAGTGITLYNASSVTAALNWVQGTVVSYDPTTGNLTFSGTSANGSGQISGATVLIATPSLGSGVNVADGSVIEAVGNVPTGSSQNITIGANPVATGTNSTTGAVTGYIPGASGDGSLLRVSNGGDISITRAFVPGLYNTSTLPVAFGPVSATPEGQLAIGAATLAGNSVILDSSGTNTLAADATLTASNYTLSSNLINLGGTNSSGLTLTPAALVRFAGAQSVTLHSYSAFNLYGDETFGSQDAPIGTLIFDGGGVYSDGGAVSVSAGNVTLRNSEAAGSSGADTTGSNGTLDISAADAIVIGQGTQTWGGFSQISFDAGSDVLFSGSGAVKAGTANVTFATPAVVADTGAAQALTTTGAIVLAPDGGALPTLASTMLGGNLALTGGAINVSNAILAPGGAITLEATDGDLTLAPGAAVEAQGSRVTLFDFFNEDVAAGTVKLTSDTGNVTIASGASIDVSAAGYGYAGTVSILATKGTATLDGIIQGNAAYKDLGGTLILNANQLSGSLPLGNSFSGAYSVTLGQGDILVDAGQTISSDTILLVANDGSVTIDGTLDASSPSGGVIEVYGAGTANGSGASAAVTGGVNIGSTARLYAHYAADDASDPASGNDTAAGVQNGGTITLGTSGIGSTTNLDPVEGFEIVLPTQSGWINVASGAQFDVSGGPGGANITNTGGTVYLRAPIVENTDGSGRSVNVDFNGTLITNAAPGGGPSGKGLVLQPYATWSTTDQQTDTTKYFDGIIDPAGWYSSSGSLVAGVFKDINANQVATWSGSGAPSTSVVTATGVMASDGVQVVTVSPGLALSVGQSVILDGAYWNMMTGTVVSYDSATGALVVNVTSKVSDGSTLSDWTVYASDTGTFIPSGNILTYLGGVSQNTDQNGNTYFSMAFSPGQNMYAGESMQFSIENNASQGTSDPNQVLTFNGTVKSYTSCSGGCSSILQFYSSTLSNAAANGTYSFNGDSAAFVYWLFGATAPAIAAQTQPLTIGTGTKVLTVAAGQSYIAGETITLTDGDATGDSMSGTITSYGSSTGALVLDVTSDTGAGNATSGSWTFAVTLPQSVLNEYLADDFFTPTSTNADHQTFYGFNPATGAAGTLMSFIENPFAGNDAAALSGLSGATIQIGQSGAPTSLSAAGALHVSPEVDLVNPQTSNNGGDISVLTDWNLGAGVADANGNPSSLDFRYNGRAPTITLRAANNVNLDASITDGFFQTAVSVGSYIPAPTDTDSTVLGVSPAGSPGTFKAFNFYDNITSGISYGDVPPRFLGTATVANPTLGNKLAAPTKLPGETTNTVDEYYAVYRTYLNAWNSFYQNDLKFMSGNYDLGGTPVPASVTNLFNAATASYSTTNLAAYQTYLNAYYVYLNAYHNFAAANATVAGTPNAPLPPPAISAPPSPSFLPAANNTPAPVKTVTDQSPISGMDLAAEASSSSYEFVAGAQFATGATAAVDPEAVVTTASLGGAVTGDVTLNGHIAVANSALSEQLYNGATNSYVTYDPEVDVPTIVRTGTGSIDMVAAGDIEWLDPLSPAAVYTAGTVAPNASGYTVPTLASAYTSGAQITGLLTTPVWATGGGEVTLSAGQDIIGIETPVDSQLITTIDGVADAQTLGSNSPSTGQFWSAWYITLGDTTGEAAAPFDTSAGGVQNGAYINYATFYQGVGALGGGNVTVNSGRNTYDLSVSLPETIQVSGGRFVGDSAPVAHDFGGGDLSVTVGGNLYSSDFYVGRGTGVIRVAGSVLADEDNPVTGQAADVSTSLWSGISSGGFQDEVPIASSGSGSSPLSLLLAVQDSYITVEAGGSISLGGVFEPTRIPTANYPYFPVGYMPAGFGAGFDSFGANSGVTLMAAGGSVSLLDAFPATLYKLNNPQADNTLPDNLLPPTLEAISVAGDLTIGDHADDFAPYDLYPSADGNLILAAGQTLSMAFEEAATNGLSLGLDSIQMVDDTISGGATLYNEVGAPTPTTLTSPLHADDPTLALILAGQDIIGEFKLIKPATMEAGRDILDTAFTGQNNSSSDVTSIIAGRDIRSTNVVDGVSYYQINDPVVSPGDSNIADVTGGVSLFELYGPGAFEVAAGRNLGPFLVNPYSEVSGGIFALGDGSNVGVEPSYNRDFFGEQTAILTYLPTQGATITTLFGVGNGVDYNAAIAAYVDPAGTGAAQGIDYLSEIAGYLGLSPDAAWTAFQALSAQKQQLLVDRAFLDFLTQVAADYHDAASPYYNKYGRAYDAIATLFPASYGYTDNNTGGSNGASVTVHTGDLWMARSRIETQTGGDINLLGPGGSIIVGANQADNISPNLEGILTLQGGSINGYVDKDVELYQSRIFTEQGGNIDLFSANGDLNAGKGPKSSAAYPPLTLICDSDGYCRVSPAGLVTGAGLGALLTIPGQDPTKSNVSLTAPHGTVDAGAAGIRVAGNLNIIALQVLNAFNIEVGGTAIGIPTSAAPNIGALDSASSAAGAATKAITSPVENHASVQPSILIVEIEGYGGDDGESEPASENRHSKEQRRSDLEAPAYDPHSAFGLIGNGALSSDQQKNLTEDERRKFLQRVERRGAL
ncbi:MAG: filamentous hemagglutinin family protein [Pseudomonadota bacterium]